MGKDQNKGFLNINKFKSGKAIKKQARQNRNLQKNYQREVNA